MNLFNYPDSERLRTYDGKFTECPQKEIKKQIRLHLELGLSITGLQALKLFKTIRLAVYISRLIKDGVPITDEWISENGKRFKRYRLKK